MPFSRPEIILFGDSITQFSFGLGGWGATIANAYQRSADVKLRGYSGYNTRWCLPLLPDIFPKQSTVVPILVTVMLGANDANLPPPLHKQSLSASRQHVPLDEYEANLAAIVRAIKECSDGSARVLLLTPPPCDEKGWHRECVSRFGLESDADPNRSHEATSLYASACLRVAAAVGVPAIDIHGAFMEQSDWQSLFSDGLHPNAAGNAIISKVVLAAIKSHYPELTPSAFGDASRDKLPMDFPDHKAIDPEDVEGSFQRFSCGLCG